MKKLLFNSVVLFSIVFGQLFLLISFVSADVGVPPSPGGVISPGDKTDKISMESEKVLFDIRQNDENSPFFSEDYNTSTIQNESHYAHVTADFVMKNVTATDVQINIIFPIPGHIVGNNWREYFDPESKTNPSINYQVRVNNNIVDYTYEAYKIENLVGDASQEFYYPSDALVVEFPVNFKASAQTTISVEYDVKWYPYVKTIYGYFNYLLETGSHWRGSIGHGEIIFQFPGEIIPSMFDHYNDQFSITDNSLVWTFTNLEPDKNHNIIVQYSPYLFTIWNNRDTAFKSITANRSDQFIVPSDSPGEHFHNLMWWNLEGNPVYLLNRNNDAENEYSRTQVGWWIAEFNENSKPWLQYEFDGSYNFDSMIINSGILDSKGNRTYDLVGKPKKIQLTYSDGSSKTVDLEDKSAEEITVSLENKQTTSIKIAILEIYPDYQGNTSWVGIDSIEFSPVGKIQKLSLYPDEEPDPNKEGIDLPDIFLLRGSTTTRLDEMSSEQMELVENLTFDVIGKNKVIFLNSINLTGTETQEKMNKLIEYIYLDTIGLVSINTYQLPFLESPATVTMYGLSFSETPDIYKDGVLATSQEVDNISYNSESGILTFNVATFSEYEARENVAEEPDADQLTIDSGEAHNKNLWIYILCFSVIFITLVSSVVVIILVRRKRKKKNTTVV